MAATPEVGIIGLAALQRDFKRMGGDASSLARVLQDAARSALEPVLSAAVGSLPQAAEHRLDGHPAGTLAADVRIGANRRGAGIRMGRAKVNWAGPTEFGGYPKDANGNSVVPFNRSGNYLYPAAAPLADQVGQAYTDATQRGLDAFDWTNEGNTPHD